MAKQRYEDKTNTLLSNFGTKQAPVVSAPAPAPTVTTSVKEETRKRGVGRPAKTDKRETSGVSFTVDKELKDDFNILATISGKNPTKLYTEYMQKMVDENRKIIEQFKQFKQNI